MTDRELLAAYARTGSEEAFSEIVARYAGLVHAACMRVLGDAHAAEDAAQAAFLVLARKARRLARGTVLSGWLFLTARHAALDLARQRQRRAHREEEAAAMRSRREARQPASWDQVRPHLDEALARLPRVQREAVVLHHLRGLSRAEVASELACPERTVKTRLERALARLRERLARQGAVVSGAVLAGYLGGQMIAEAPAGLVPSIQAACLGKAAAAPAALSAMEGVMKAMFWVKVKVLAAALAGVVIAGTATAAAIQAAGGSLGPPASAGSGKPAPVNPYNGMQEREEVYEFTQKPKVSKAGDKWVITFASKGKCDATVAVLDKDGKIIRHLASGVLGKNVPYPFQQNSLAQKIEWDGQTDDFKKAPAGCKVKVSLGLKPELDRNLLGPAHNYLREKYSPSLESKSIRVATDGQGNTYVAAFPYVGMQVGQVYDKAGKYVRTFWPPAAKDVEKTGVKLTATKWGDKTPWAGWFGPFREFDASKVKGKGKDGVTLETMLAASGLDAGQFKEADWPANLPPIKPPFKGNPKDFGLPSKWYLDFFVQPEKQLIHGLPGGVLNEETGIFERVRGAPDRVGLDGLQYYTGGYNEGWGMVISRKTADGKPVPFEVGQAKDGKFYTGFLGTTGGGPNGTDVTEDGTIVTGFYGWVLESPQTPEIQEKVLSGNMDPGRVGERRKKLDAMGAKYTDKRNAIFVIDRKGNILTTRAVEGLNHYTGNFMDRDGNIYLSQGGILPAGQKELHGVAECPKKPRGWGGSILKFRGLGGKYPLGRLYWAVQNSGGGDLGDPKEKASSDAMEIAHVGYKPGPVRASGLLWAYGGITNLTGFNCECNASGFHLDHWARLWVPNNAVSGVMVVDSNGNFVMRVGQYGNVDDEGIRFAASIRGVWATDEALYVLDEGNVSLSRILLKYHAEETVSLDGSASASAPTRAPAPAPAALAKEDAPAEAPAPAAAAASGAGSGQNPAVVCRGWWSLAMSYKRAGRKDKAREYLQKIIAQHPDTDHAARARRELARM